MTSFTLRPFAVRPHRKRSFSRRPSRSKSEWWNDIFRRVLTIAVLLLSTTSASLSQSVDDYRSRNTGNWNNSGTWQRYNGTAWTNNQPVPDAADGVITIRNRHTVTVNKCFNLDELVVKAGALLKVTKRIRLVNGPGLDLTHDGAIQLAGENLVLLTGSTAVTSATDVEVQSSH